MSEQNMKIVRRLLEEVWTEGNLELLPELMAEDVVAYPMPQIDALQGRDEYMRFIAVYKGVFLDMKFNLEDQFASGNKVATRWVTRVTDISGNVAEDSDTGEEIAVNGTTITHHDSDGKIIAEWATWDTQSLLASVGAPRIFDQLAVSL